MAQLSSSAVVVGGGVVGLSVFRELSAVLPDVILLEKTSSLGQATSSRNSGVIHSGIYHPDKMLKGRLCRRGRSLLYSYCAERGVPFSRCGKVVIASSNNEISYIKNLHAASKKLGVPSPEFLDTPEAVRQVEPNVDALCGVHFPSTGVVDVPDLMSKLHADGVESGGEVLLNSKITAVRRATRALGPRSKETGWTLSVDQGGDCYDVTTPLVVNAAGHSAPSLYTSLGLVAPTYPAPPRHYFARGNYFKLSSSGPPVVNGLVYPVPSRDLSGLGIHATVGVDGGVKFGPDVEWFSPSVSLPSGDFYVLEDAEVDSLKAKFSEAIERYLPNLSDFGDLQYDYSGVRPKLSHPDVGHGGFDGGADFWIRQDSVGFINLFGIESPGVTSCLAISEEVKKIIDARH